MYLRSIFTADNSIFSIIVTADTSFHEGRQFAIDLGGPDLLLLKLFVQSLQVKFCDRSEINDFGLRFIIC